MLHHATGSCHLDAANSDLCKLARRLCRNTTNMAHYHFFKPAHLRAGQGENIDELLIACAKHLQAHDSAHLHLLRANQVHKPLLLAQKAPGDVFHPWRQRGTEQQRLHVL